jgi:hypothetical protein
MASAIWPQFRRGRAVTACGSSSIEPGAVLIMRRRVGFKMQSGPRWSRLRPGDALTLPVAGVRPLRFRVVAVMLVSDAMTAPALETEAELLILSVHLPATLTAPAQRLVIAAVAIDRATRR